MKLGDARVFSVPTFSSDSAPRASTPVDRWVAGRIRASVASARLRFVLWDGFELPYAGDAPVGTIVFRNRRALFSWVWNPDLNFGEAYMFGAVDLQGDLVAMLCEIYRALRRTRPREVASSQRSNDERAARENVHRHYDLGNDFYRLWLDREMLYTCAYFPTPDATLEEAQIAKMDRVCRKLEARSRASAWSKPGAAGARWRCSWPGSTACRSGRSTCPRSRSPTRAPGPKQKGWPAASSSSRTTIATSGASTTRSSRSACSSTWAWATTRRSAPWSSAR